MSIRRILLAGALAAVSPSAMAQLSGTPQEQAACRPDVRRFCYKIAENQGTDAYLRCLREHRSGLSPRCRAVLENHGQ
ncbi:MAG: hypothetical protein JO288_18795 [Hyphomicrobiales bacterium]|nr:hypothetical protein [Hyphomicrobiales bacterium]